ncbi:MAG: hypothetical protein ABJG56_01210 [Lentilitoribacter sp.]
MVIDITGKSNSLLPSKKEKVIHFGKVGKLSFGLSANFNKFMARTIEPARQPYQKSLNEPFPTLSSVSLLKLNQTNSNQKLLLKNLQNTLTRRFGSASSSGLLRINVTENSPLLTPFSPAQKLMVNPNSTAIKKENSSKSKHLHFIEGHSTRAQIKTPDFSCNSSMNLNVSTWSDGRPFLIQLSTHYANLYDTLGKQNIDVTMKLVRLYLYFGFGAEAKHLLSSYNILPNKWPELNFIADTLEERSNNWPSSILSQTKCKGPAVFWLSLSHIGNKSFINRQQNEIIFELSLLPFQLRQVMAPRISSRFLTAGNVKSAQAALRTLTRTKAPTENFIALEHSALLVEANKPEKALKILEKITPNSEAAVKSFIKRVEIQGKENREIDEDTIGLLEAYLVEYGNTTLEKQLRTTLIQNLSKKGRFEQAFYEVESLEKPDQLPLLQQIYTDLVTSANDTIFAEYILERQGQNVLSLEPALSLAIAHRLVKLGFLAEGNDQLANIIGKEDSDEHNVIRAEIALLQNQNGKAAKLLNGARTPKAMSLKIQLYTRLGEYEKATEIRNELNEVTQPHKGTSLLSDQLQNGKVRDNILGQLDLISQRDFTPPKPTNGMLAEITKLIDESNKTRETLANILEFDEKLP